MKESFLHYVWATSQYSKKQLQTTQQEVIDVVHVGFPHQDGGPDFTNAKIRIDGKLWVGHVELHIKSSEWYDHHHHLDPAYDSTILHVVYHHDQDVFLSDGSEVPCLALENRIPKSLIHRYTALCSNSHTIPCDALLKEVPSEIKTLCIESMFVARLSEKTEPIIERLRQSNNDWSEVFYQEICAALGLRINKLPFLMLAKQLPFRLLSKHKNNLFQLEAMLFGTAGFLKNNALDAYESSLQREYRFLKNKYDLNPIDGHLWKFLRLRPANFPTIRIAQLAMLVHQSEHLFSQVQSNLDFMYISSLFNSTVSSYWQEHYTFNKKHSTQKKAIGKSRINLIIINAIAPTFYCYSELLGDVELNEKVMKLMENTEAEKNKTVLYYRHRKFHVRNAIHTQGILQLHNKFCTFKNCLDCQIGHFVLKQHK